MPQHTSDLGEEPPGAIKYWLIGGKDAQYDLLRRSVPSASHSSSS